MAASTLRVLMAVASCFSRSGLEIPKTLRLVGIEAEKSASHNWLSKKDHRVRNTTVAVAWIEGGFVGENVVKQARVNDHCCQGTSALNRKDIWVLLCAGLPRQIRPKARRD